MKDKTFFFINVIDLPIGLSMFILIDIFFENRILIKTKILLHQGERISRGLRSPAHSSVRYRTSFLFTYLLNNLKTVIYTLAPGL
jgi:hypothetical protein